MTLRVSTGLRNAILGTDDLKATFEGTAGFSINIYSGTRPASADDAATGTLLVSLTGLHFEASPVAGAIEKAVAETWSANAAATGTAGYFRIFHADDTPTTSSTAYPRLDGTISTSGADMNLQSTSITSGAPFVIVGGSITVPAS